LGSYVESFYISTKGFDDLIDITLKVQNVVLNAKAKTGIVNVACLSSTKSILTLDEIPGLKEDLSKIFETLVPINKIYQHDSNWHDENAHAHLKAAILKNNITLPLIDGIIKLDDYQQIALFDFDSKPSNVEVIVAVIY